MCMPEYGGEGSALLCIHYCKDTKYRLRQIFVQSLLALHIIVIVDGGGGGGQVCIYLVGGAHHDA